MGGLSHYEREIEVIAITVDNDQLEILKRLTRDKETLRDAARRIFYAAIELYAVGTMGRSPTSAAGVQAQIEKEKRHETDS